MSISRRQLETLGEPFGESATQQKLGGGYICGGGDSAPSTPDKTTTTTSTIPDWAKPYAQKAMGQASALTDISQNPFQTYGGQQIAGFNPMQQQAFGNVQQMTASPATGAGMDISANVANQAQQYGQYQPQNFGNQFQGAGFRPMGIQDYGNVQNPSLQNFQMGPAQNVSGSNLQNYQMGPASNVASKDFTDPNTASQYMNPYTQNVVDVQQREAQRAADVAKTSRNAQAVGAGAFGGSRQAIMDAEAARNLATQKGDIQAQGLNTAYNQAQQAFQSDQARALQAQQANQQAGLTVGQQNLGANLQTQQLGAGQNLQAQLANQQAGLTTGQQNLQSMLGVQQLGAGQNLQAQLANQQAGLQAQGQGLQQNLAGNAQAMQNAQLNAQYGLAGQQASEQSRQFGSNLGLQGLQQQLAAGNQLGNLGQMDYAQNMGINAAQQQAGAQQQALQQQQLTQRYNDFLNQQRYPYQQLGFMSDILRGTPSTGSTQTMYQAQPPLSNQLAGLATAGLGGLSYGYGAQMAK